jgi:hypothetical protein
MSLRAWPRQTTPLRCPQRASHRPLVAAGAAGEASGWRLGWSRAPVSLGRRYGTVLYCTVLYCTVLYCTPRPAMRWRPALVACPDLGEWPPGLRRKRVHVWYRLSHNRRVRHSFGALLPVRGLMQVHTGRASRS